MENEKIVKYQCRSCKEYKDRKEFHYKNFETMIPRKMCWDCELETHRKDSIQNYIDICNKKNDEIRTLYSRIRTLENINNIKTPAYKVEAPRYKHHSLNIWMEEGNLNEAWMMVRGQYRKYRTYPNKFVENDFCVVYNKPDGSKKYYSLEKMHEWIMQAQTWGGRDKKEVEAPF